jgi:hypothetical protein
VSIIQNNNIKKGKLGYKFMMLAFLMLGLICAAQVIPNELFPKDKDVYMIASWVARIASIIAFPLNLFGLLFIISCYKKKENYGKKVIVLVGNIMLMFITFLFWVLVLWSMMGGGVSE